MRVFNRLLPFFLFSFFIFTSCQCFNSEPQLIPQENTDPIDRIKLPDTPVGKLIENHLKVMYGMGDDAEAIYQSSLDSLRNNIDESLTILENAYNESNKMHYGDRWALVQTLTDLNMLQVLGSLTRITNERLPVRDSLTDHQISMYEEESVIKLTALQGLGNLSVRSDSAAVILSSFFNHKDSVIRLESMNYLAEAIRSVDAERKRQLMAYLPKSYVFVENVSKIQPIGIQGANPNLKPTGAGKGPAPKKD